MSQAAAAVRAGLSQPRWSELERGRGAKSPVETWATAAAAVGEQLVGFLERVPGATPPRDIEHIRRQSALIEFAEPGGWRALPELALDSGAVRSRSVDVAFLRVARREAILAEIWDWFDDVGASLRSFDAKREALTEKLRRDHGGEWTVRCLFVVRRTARNEQLLSELRPVFAARFAGSSIAWLRALADPSAGIPEGDGLLWSTLAYRLQASRLGTRQ